MADEIKKDEAQAQSEEVKVEETIIEEPVVEEAEVVDSKKEKDRKIKKYKEELAERDKEIFRLKDQLLRERAELENFKKRNNQERIQDRKYASKNLVYDILTPLDQLNKIVKLEPDNDLLKNYLIGFKMINDQLFQVLETDGLKEIEALNKQFDPKYHHAVEKACDKTKANGINLEVIQRGYTYKEQLLRPAMVKVNEWSDENGKDK